MMRPTVAVAFALLASLSMRSLSAEPEAPSPIAVRIVPSRHDEKLGRAIELYRPSDHFHVVVTNVSDRRVKLWREWCGWGYANLSFIVIGDDGRSVTVSKKPKAWRKNYPDSIIVDPGEQMVFEVNFDELIWQNSPLPEHNRSRTVKIEAVYTIQADKETKELGVWTGQVSSTSEAYTIAR